MLTQKEFKLKTTISTLARQKNKLRVSIESLLKILKLLLFYTWVNVNMKFTFATLSKKSTMKIHFNDKICYKI